MTVLALSAIGLARADELTLPAPADAASPDIATDAKPLPAKLPQRGERMAEVLKQFGAPAVKHPTVGGHEPKRPPITRWDYPDFAVIFEKDIVVDTVVPGHLAPVQNTQGLQMPAPAAQDSPAPPPP